MLKRLSMKSTVTETVHEENFVLILYDTSAILMLLRITPTMFSDPRFECVTIRSIYEEITQTPKFRTKYPWLREMRSKIKSLPTSISDTDNVKLHYETITALNWSGDINPKTSRPFDLSKEDRMVVACAVANEYAISSGDTGLCDFAFHHFKLHILSPLDVINSWIKKKLIVWNDEKQAFLKDWALQNEKPQPDKAKSLFKALTGYKYLGS
jgi:hypothetical protein